MLLQLNLREGQGNSPPFLGLLKEIHGEGECEAARQMFGKPIHQFVCLVQATEAESDGGRPAVLQTGVWELRARLKVLGQSTEQSWWWWCWWWWWGGGSGERGEDRQGGGGGVPQLGQGVGALRSRNGMVSVKSRPWPGEAGHYPGYGAGCSPGSAQSKPGSAGESGCFCCGCGEGGHIVPGCGAPENSQEVIQGLVRRVGWRVRGDRERA